MLVAPYTGAWIETKGSSESRTGISWSHPTRVRGLKQREVAKAEQELAGRTLHGCVD